MKDKELACTLLICKKDTLFDHAAIHNLQPYERPQKGAPEGSKDWWR